MDEQVSEPFGFKLHFWIMNIFNLTENYSWTHIHVKLYKYEKLDYKTSDYCTCFIQLHSLIWLPILMHSSYIVVWVSTHSFIWTICVISSFLPVINPSQGSVRQIEMHELSPLEYICRTLKCDGNLKFDGHAKVRWSTLKYDGVSR